jgi:hypothetical protein
MWRKSEKLKEYKMMDIDQEVIIKMRSLKENQIAIKENLVLGPDIYSLAMYGFYRDS